MIEEFVNVSGARVLIAPVLLLRLALRLDQWDANALRNEVIRTLTRKAFWLKGGLSVGMLFLGLSAFPWIDSTLAPVVGILASFFLPLLLLLPIFQHVDTVPTLTRAPLLAAVLLVPTLLVVCAMKLEERIALIKHVAVCHGRVALASFLFYCFIECCYGTALAGNTPERERVVASFAHTGAVGLVMLLGAGVLNVAARLLAQWASRRHHP